MKPGNVFNSVTDGVARNNAKKIIFIVQSKLCKKIKGKIFVFFCKGWPLWGFFFLLKFKVPLSINF